MTRYTPDWLQQGTYSAAMDRRVLQALWSGPASTGCAVTVGSGMTVNVAAGQVAVPTANQTGTLVCTSDAVEPVALAAAPGTNSRIDLVVCQARGNDLDGGANNDFIFAAVTGTVAASPVAPALPANAVALAQIAVGTGVAAIVAGNITDVRPGGLTPVKTVGRVIGPAATVNLATGFAFAPVLTVSVPVVAGRRYRVFAAAFINIGGASQSGRNAIQVTPVDITAVNANTGRAQVLNQAQGGGFGPNGTWTWTATASGPQTFTLSAAIDNGGTVLANNAELSVDDIGPP